MSIDFLTWLAAFVLQAALLGKSMFTLISLTDLESDNINPFDCAEQVNRFVLVEYGGQLLVTLCTVAAGKWLLAAVQLGLCAYMVHLYRKKQVYLQAADAFKQLPSFKKRRMWVLAVHLVCFLLVTYRMIESAIHTVLTPEGREAAKKLFTDSHHFLHY